MQTSISSLLKLPSAFVLEQAASRWLVRGSRWLNLVIGIRSNLSQWLKAGRPRLWTTLCQMYILPQPEISSRHWEPPSYGADSLPNFKQIIFSIFLNILLLQNYDFTKKIWFYPLLGKFQIKINWGHFQSNLQQHNFKLYWGHSQFKVTEEIFNQIDETWFYTFFGYIHN